jgi:hypothetical protein
MIALAPVSSLSLLLVFIPASIQLTTSGTCPSADAVRSRLDSLIGEQDGGPRSVTLDNSPDGLKIVLAEHDGSVVSRRVIPSNRSCDELAQMAALILASWLSDLSSQAVTAQPLPSLSGRSPTPPVVMRSPWSWEVALAPTGSFAGSLAPGGLLQLEVSPATARWIVRLLGSYDGPRQRAEGPGEISWQRLQGGLGASYELLPSPYRLEVGGDLLLSDVLMRGLQFPSDASATSLDPGLDLTVRLSLLRGHWHPWVGIWGDLWIRQEIPSVQGLTLGSALPPLEAFAGIGLSWQSVERF